MVKVLCAADDLYCIPLTVTLSSLVINLIPPQNLEIFIIDGGILQKNKQKILRSLELLKPEKIELSLQWIDPKKTEFEKIVQSLPNITYVSRNTYYRLFLDQLLPNNLEKIIYLDSDLILEADINQLWQTEMNNYHLLAVQDMGHPYISSQKTLAGYQELSIPGDAKYFNAGVLFIDLKQYRKDHIGQKCLDYLNQYRKQARFADQDALNAVLAGKWGELDPRWNQTPWILGYQSWQESPFSESVYNQIITNPYIIHFAVPGKPWHFKVNYRDSEKRYYHYLDQTLWKGWRPKQTLQKRLNNLLNKLNIK